MMQEQEFVDLCEAAIRAAKKSTEVPRCIDALNLLKKAPESIAVEVIPKGSIGSRFCRYDVEHQNPKIRSEAEHVRDVWLMYLYATGRKNKSPTPTKKPVVVSMMKKKLVVVSMTGDSMRDKVRDLLQTSLAKVCNEVATVEMKRRVASCVPWVVAVSVESALFDKFGSFTGPQKAKYRSILFNMGDSNNPDMKRKVLIGEINGEKLVKMGTGEMVSEKIQMEVQQIKERARIREENRINITFQSYMIMT